MSLTPEISLICWTSEPSVSNIDCGMFGTFIHSGFPALALKLRM